MGKAGLSRITDGESAGATALPFWEIAMTTTETRERHRILRAIRDLFTSLNAACDDSLPEDERLEAVCESRRAWRRMQRRYGYALFQENPEMWGPMELVAAIEDELTPVTEAIQ